jgi:tRNA A37 threonylcarbamoyladenosine dehydratase
MTKQNNTFEKDLHTQAIELMEKLIKKYKLKDEMSSLDEFLYENVYKFSDKDIDEIIDLIDKFNE